MASSQNFNDMIWNQSIDACIALGIDLLNESDFRNDLKQAIEKECDEMKVVFDEKKLIMTVTIFLSDKLKAIA